MSKSKSRLLVLWQDSDRPALLPLQEEDFVELEEVSRLIEAKYKQFFDSILVNDGLQDACMKLCSVIHQAQNEPQWIPVSWILQQEEWWRNWERNESGSAQTGKY